MDDLNITMKEYIKLEEAKARKRRKVFNWKTAKYGKIWYDENNHDLRSVETEFPAIAFTCKPTVSSLNDEIDFRVLIDDSDDEDYTVLHFSGLPDLMAEGLSSRMLMEHRDAQGQSVTFWFGEAVTDLDTVGALQFQLGGAKKRISWREFILALGLYTVKEMQTVGFDAYWAESPRQIPDKGGYDGYG
ncbi:hypothetical protein Tco_1002384 [Tanacetum coccineum]|uniref:Uncharacterized protein n=1 Tax=Tanacetum coccineum TaxID=301880 RepID=A0ABQ5F638_9ASTR